jgi:hypothetical protein
MRGRREAGEELLAETAAWDMIRLGRDPPLSNVGVLLLPPTSHGVDTEVKCIEQRVVCISGGDLTVVNEPCHAEGVQLLVKELHSLG